MRVRLVFAATICLVALCSSPASADPILYGGLGGHNNGDSTNDGALAIVNQTTGAVTVVGHPAGVTRLSGLAFGLNGTLFATTQPAGGFPPPPGPTGASSLITLNADTGALISNIGLIKDGTTPINIADLAVQPGTGLLFGIRGPNDGLGGQGRLYTINTTTGLATLIGNTGDFFGSIAFAPNGTLYMSAADLGAQGGLVNMALKTLNPTNAAILTSVPTIDFFGALGIRPNDGVIFGGNGDAHQLFRVNPATGAETLVGDTGLTFVGDLDFRAAPEPSSVVLLALGLLMVAGARRRS
jgi:hypothetical protein